MCDLVQDFSFRPVGVSACKWVVYRCSMCLLGGDLLVFYVSFRGWSIGVLCVCVGR